jgi:hypothetical protein
MDTQDTSSTTHEQSAEGSANAITASWGGDNERRADHRGLTAITSPKTGATMHVRLWRKGESGNPAGRPAAGAVVVEWYNAMAGWTDAQLKAVLKDDEAPRAKKAAARKWMDAGCEDRTKGGTPVADSTLEQILDRTIGGIHKNVNVTHAATPEQQQANALNLEKMKQIALLMNGGELPEL